ncbi:MAG TPA: hypothetical protein VJB59_09875 [Bdellovibrionota bacterium]|nr:hypothetical protein [Bdellovibrionota bacterium]
MKLHVFGEQEPDVTIEPIHLTVRLGQHPVDSIITDGSTTVASIDGLYWKLGTYSPGKPEPATALDAMKLKETLPPSIYTGECRVSGKTDKKYVTLNLKRGDRARPYHFGCMRDVPPYSGPVTSAYCLDKDIRLFWAVPFEIRVHDLRPRPKKELARLHLPGIIPSAIACSKGLVVVGTNSGELHFLSFWPNCVHFILSLENEAV